MTYIYEYIHSGSRTFGKASRLYCSVNNHLGSLGWSGWMPEYELCTIIVNLGSGEIVVSAYRSLQVASQWDRVDTHRCHICSDIGDRGRRSDIDLLQSTGRSWYNRWTVLLDTRSKCVRQVRRRSRWRPKYFRPGHHGSRMSPRYSLAGSLMRLEKITASYSLGRVNRDSQFLCQVNIGVWLMLVASYCHSSTMMDSIYYCVVDEHGQSVFTEHGDVVDIHIVKQGT